MRMHVGHVQRQKFYRRYSTGRWSIAKTSATRCQHLLARRTQYKVDILYGLLDTTKTT